MTTTSTLNACADPTMPFIRLAVDPAFIEPRLRSLMPRGDRALALSTVRIVRWKRGRRCLIEYDLHHEGDGTACRTLVGKARARSLDTSTYELAKHLAEGGLGPDSADGTSVPAPRGTVPECHMWLQEKVSGRPGWDALIGPDASDVAARIGRAIARLQAALPRLPRTHSIADELSHLRATLEMVRAGNPQWARRLREVWRACERLAATVEDPTPSGVHRDFYHDQVIVDDERVWLLDLDLAALGDPAVDVGNFTAHLTEQSLRLLGDPDGLAQQETGVVSGYLEAGGRARPEAIELYKTLSLVRHIHLSTLFASRRPYARALLKLCEQRLGL